MVVDEVVVSEVVVVVKGIKEECESDLVEVMLVLEVVM